jgi:hypothetical protein
MARKCWWAWVDSNYRPHPYQLSPGRLRRAVKGCDALRFACVHAALVRVRVCYGLRPLATDIDSGVHQIVHQLFLHQNRAVALAGMKGNPCRARGPLLAPLSCVRWPLSRDFAAVPAKRIARFALRRGEEKAAEAGQAAAVAARVLRRKYSKAGRDLLVFKSGFVNPSVRKTFHNHKRLDERVGKPVSELALDAGFR